MFWWKLEDNFSELWISLMLLLKFWNSILLDILVISDTYMVLWILFDDNVATVCNNGNLPLCKGAGQALPNVDQRAFKDKRIREMRKARYIHANIRGPKRHQNYTRTLDRSVHICGILFRWTNVTPSLRCFAIKGVDIYLSTKTHRK